MIAHALLVAVRIVRAAQVAHMPEGVAVRLQLLELLLREVADAQVRRGHAPAGQRRRLAARQHLGQGGLSGAIRAQQRNAVLGPDGQVDARRRWSCPP